jgi:hypothetical protein
MKKTPIQRLVRLTVSASLVLAACDSPIPPEPPRLTPDELRQVGTYYLESLRGRELPAATVTAAGVNQTVYLALLRLDSNKTYELLVDARFCSSMGSCGEVFTRQFQSPRAWHLSSDGTLGFEEGNNSSVIRSLATSDGRTIVFDSTAVYRRVDPTLQPRTLDLRPDSLILARGQTQNVYATTIPYSTQVISIVVRDTMVATLLPSGAMQPRIPGVTYVVATVGTLRDSSKITVR